MQLLNTEHFYANLPSNNQSLNQLLLNNEIFRSIPDDWYVIITDIKNSTFAVSSGLHEDVNLIATGSIVAVLNIAFKAGISIPFFFGGDGATFIVPPNIVNDCMKALVLYKQNSLSNFNIDLRTGVIAVKHIYEKEYKLQISKFNSSESFSIPILLGDGLSYAEKLIKADDYLFDNPKELGRDLDLSGMQCRWDKIEPPENSEEVVTLIIIAQESNNQAMAFSKVIKYIDEIYGAPEKRQPISVSKLIFKTSFNNLGREMKAKVGKTNFLEQIKNWLINLYGYVYFSTKNGKEYLKKLVQMSDTLVIDGRINTVITGTEVQRLALQKRLNRLEKEQEILYGLYVSKESIMSCYVRDLEDDHIHFVDGGDGGYTQAANILKQKIAVK